MNQNRHRMKRRSSMNLFKGVMTILLVGFIAMFIAFFPDLRRYLKMRAM
jgi:hypothetical protein